MGAAEAMERDGVIERFEALVDKVDTIEQRQMVMIGRLAAGEVNRAIPDEIGALVERLASMEATLTALVEAVRSLR